jgi:hypothetical protein
MLSVDGSFGRGFDSRRLHHHFLQYLSESVQNWALPHPAATVFAEYRSEYVLLKIREAAIRQVAGESASHLFRDRFPSDSRLFVRLVRVLVWLSCLTLSRSSTPIFGVSYLRHPASRRPRIFLTHSSRYPSLMVHERL